MDTSLIVVAAVGFLAVVLSLEGLYNLWSSRSSPQARRIARRLEMIGGDTAAIASIERSRESVRMPRLNAWLRQLAIGQRLLRFVSASGVNISPAELITMSTALGLLGFVLPGLFAKPQIFGAALGLGLAVAPWLRVASRRNARISRIENQFPEVLDLMSRSLRAGHAFPSAVKMVADEIPEPLGQDFRALFDEMNYGVPTDEALARLADRVPLADVSYFVVAVLIQRESGGNLAELLDSIAKIVRERLKLFGQVRTLSAEGKMSACILTGLPFCVALAVNLINPDFMSLLWTDPMGHKMVGASLFMMLTGILWMRSIVRIRV